VDRSLRDRALGVGLLAVVTAGLGLLALAFPEHSAMRQLLLMIAATLGVFFLPLGVLLVVSEMVSPERE
jgi:hypothetical protein